MRELIDTTTLFPLDPKQFRTECATCGEKAAYWETRSALLSTDGVPAVATRWCSICYLYESEWAQRCGNKEIRDLIDGIEKTTNQTFERDESGKLSSYVQANQVLGRLVLLCHEISERVIDRAKVSEEAQ